ncbi:MAG: S-layer homology domain-containing protein [Evtepia gabavorous]
MESGTWYADAVAWAAANDIVNGTSATTFAPNSPITREQMAAILYRYAAYKWL